MQLRGLILVLAVLVAALPAGEATAPITGGRPIVGVGGDHADNLLDPFTAEAVDPAGGTFAVIIVDDQGEDRVVLIGFARAAARDRFAELPFAQKRLIAEAVRGGRMVIADLTAAASEPNGRR